MPHRIRPIVLFLILALGSANAQTDSTSRLLPVPYRPQLMSNWCWAASGSMIMRYWKTIDPTAFAWSQCEQAIALYRTYPNPPIPDTCPDVLPGYLNLQSTPFMLGEPYTKLKIDSALSWSAVKNQIDSSMPFASLWAWHGVTDSTRGKHWGNHWIVITGYQTSSYGEPHVSYSDPWAADKAVYKLIPFSEYQAPDMPALVNNPGYRFYQTVSTYFSIKPQKR
jgi:hypothetical protein